MKKFLIILPFLFLFSCATPQVDDWDFASLEKPKENPIIGADSTLTFVCPVQNKEVKWQRADVFNPAAIVKDNKVYLLLRCEDNPAALYSKRTSRIGLAYSEDGLHFTKHPTPVLYPDNDDMQQYDFPGGCEDPRVVKTNDDSFVMTYTSWNYDTARLSVAFSKDLIHWEKKGLAFEKAYDGKFKDYWSKSGSIVCKMIDGQQVATKVNGKYWMYWGELYINVAWSDNLIDWHPIQDEKGEHKMIVGPRPQKFDSQLAECGPPALITDEGIVLFYNGKNADGENTDKSLPEGTYSVGKAVFDITNPEMLISRSETPILTPTLPHEITGQYESGTTFAEGLVYFKSKWFMYYGTADSFVGVAVSK